MIEGSPGEPGWIDFAMMVSMMGTHFLAVAGLASVIGR
jgi:hypothetical protein